MRQQCSILRWLAALATLLAASAASPLRADSTVVFNEIQYQPASRDPDLEWIEFHNQMAVDMDISNWYVTGGLFYAFPEGTIVEGGGFLLLARTPSLFAAETGISDVHGPYDGRISNDGERLELRNKNDRIMDVLDFRVGGRWPVGPAGSGATLAKRDPDTASGPARNWATSAQVGGTPGAHNFPSEAGGSTTEGLVSYWSFDDAIIGAGIYEEDFQEPDGPPSDWSIAQSEVSVSGGTLILSTAGAEPFAWAGVGGVPQAFGAIRSVTARLEFAGIPGDSIGRHGGLIVCASEPTNRYASQSAYTIDWIDRDGDHGYRIIKVTGGNHEAIAVGTAHANPGAVWSVTFEPTRFILTVDGQEVGRYTDGDYRSGFVGVWCYLNPGQELHVDDVRIEYENPASDGADGNDGSLGAGASVASGLTGRGSVAFGGGADTFVDVGPGTGNNFGVTAGITVEALAKPEWSGAAPDEDAIFRKDDPAGPIVLTLREAGGMPAIVFGIAAGGTYGEQTLLLDGQGGRPSLASLQDGQAHHIAATYDAATSRRTIYVDGEALATGTASPGGAIVAGGTAAAMIGNATGGDAPFAGVIDEVAIWSRALPAATIEAHVAAAASGKNYFSAPDPDADGPGIAFNEIVPGDAGEGWVELINAGTVRLQLADHVIASAGGGGGFFVLPARALAAGERLVLSATEIGFPIVPDARLFLFTPGRAGVLAAAEVEDGPTARFPDGTGRWLTPDEATPGATNRVTLEEAIVINEIMYKAMGDPEGACQYVELFNRGDQAVDLSGWQFTDGISYTFPAGTGLGPGEYLVIAADPDRIRADYGIANVDGPFAGGLDNQGERIEISDARGNVADEVHYYDRGRWPSYADGGGSSLELRDPRADNTIAEAWAASDEGSKASWRDYSYRGPAVSTPGPTQWNEFVMGLLDEGEVLLDDIHVVESPSGSAIQFLSNSTFEAGATDWRIIGTHGRSTVIEDPDAPGNHVLHLIANGPTEHMHNHAETTYASSRRVTTGREYEISFRAKWLAGSNQLNTRLYFNRLARTTLLEVPARRGTPGARNSRFAANIGPTFRDLGHAPVVPAAAEEVEVSIRADDPDGVAGCTLFWSVQGGAWGQAAMAEAAGVYTATIPGQSAGRIVQFYVRGQDALGETSTFPAKGPDSGALYKVEDGLARLGSVHNLRIVVTPANANFLHLSTNVMSNESLPATIIYDEKEVFYDGGVRLKGSERGRLSDVRVGFHLYFPPDHLLRGVHDSVSIDRSGGGGRTGQDEILIKHIANHAGGVPGMYDDICRIISPRTAHTGFALLMMAQFNDVYLRSQYDNGMDGTLFKYELIYYPTTTVNGRVDGLKLPQPDSVIGTDLTNLGNDEELYRWFFLIRNNRDVDDYSRLMAMCKAFASSSTQLEAAMEEVIDVDEWMRTFAFYSLCGVGDTYTQGNYHNNVYYVRPGDERLLAFPWDMDFSFTQDVNAGLWGNGNLARVIAIPGNTRRFYRHLIDIIDTTYNPTYMRPWAQHYGALCSQTTTFNSHINYITQRRSVVLSKIPKESSFAITTQSGADFTTDADEIEIRGTAPYAVETIQLNGDPAGHRWRSASVWSVDVRLHIGENRLVFMGLDGQGAIVGTAAITVTSTAGFVQPKVVWMDPSRGPEAGGTEVRFLGEELEPGIRVRFGGVEAASVRYASAVEIFAVTPPGKGTVSVVVENPGGLTAPSPTDFTYEPGETLFRRADTNADGFLDLGDAIRTLDFLFADGEPLACDKSADIDDDGVLTIGDPIGLLGYIFAQGAPPAAPFPECGADPTPDDPLPCPSYPGCP
ncbi:MAG: lamin tail domain-containing protein [Planctomycetes bacterium]|nr:lamin tail domain-containing protein [Planctomycetota bacterium]